MAKTKAKTYKKLSDKIFSSIIRSQNECEAAGYEGLTCSRTFDCAHIISRRYSATRTSLQNAYCLCWVHHRFFHDYPRSFSRFITDTWAQSTYDAVYTKSRTPTKVDWQERYEKLKDIQARMDEGEITLKEARQSED